MRPEKRRIEKNSGYESRKNISRQAPGQERCPLQPNRCRRCQSAPISRRFLRSIRRPPKNGEGGKGAEQDSHARDPRSAGYGPPPKAPAQQAAGDATTGRCRAAQGSNRSLRAPPKENGFGRPMESARIRQTGPMTVRGTWTCHGAQSQKGSHAARGLPPLSAMPAPQVTGRSRPA